MFTVLNFLSKKKLILDFIYFANIAIWILFGWVGVFEDSMRENFVNIFGYLFRIFNGKCHST